MSGHCEIFEHHINIIRQLTQVLVKYDIMIQQLTEMDDNDETKRSKHAIEIEFFKDIQKDLNKQIGEHEGLCFIISKLSTIGGNNTDKLLSYDNNK